MQARVSGALFGCFYALMALGFAMILGITHSLNLAHGELVTLGGYVGYGLWAGSGLHPLLLLDEGRGVLAGAGAEPLESARLRHTLLALGLERRE